MAVTTENQTNFDKLIHQISQIKGVEAIGLSGGVQPMPKPGSTDLDVFIYGSRVPTAAERKEAVDQLGDLVEAVHYSKIDNEAWGLGDCLMLGGVETWLMYFEKTAVLAHLEAVLAGKYPDKVDNYFYPVGRCAMFLKMGILYDPFEFLSQLQIKLADYPKTLGRQLWRYHLELLDDVEDLGRAVLRKDILFFHFALDLALDHFLQALFALNSCYFPSRKRSFEYIANFSLKPEACEARLGEVLRLAADPETVELAYKNWLSLAADLKAIS